MRMRSYSKEYEVKTLDQGQQKITLNLEYQEAESLADAEQFWGGEANVIKLLNQIAKQRSAAGVNQAISKFNGTLAEAKEKTSAWEALSRNYTPEVGDISRKDKVERFDELRALAEKARTSGATLTPDQVMALLGL